jgi:hypothetical protein
VVLVACAPAHRRTGAPAHRRIAAVIRVTGRRADTSSAAVTSSTATMHSRLSVSDDTPTSWADSNRASIVTASSA